MSSVQDSIFETRVRMDMVRPWPDLPQRAVGLVVEKLRFVDQMSVIAVCKNWRTGGRDFVRCSKRLPWVMRHTRISNTRSLRYSFQYEIFIPYSQKVGVQLNSVPCNPHNNHLYAFAYKDSWVLLGGKQAGLYLHNPFTNCIIMPDLEVSDYNMQAAIVGSPSSPGCKICTVEIHRDGLFHFNTYSLSGEGHRRGTLEGEELSFDDMFYSMVYMKDELYCLFTSCQLNSYGLVDGEWKFLTEGLEAIDVYGLDMSHAWLLEIEEKLVMVCMYVDSDYEWKIFRFDFTEMAWVPETSLESRAFFISGRVAWSAPLTDCHGKKQVGCKVYFDSYYTDVAGGRGFKCYSLTPVTKADEDGNAVTEFESKAEETAEYSWISRPDRDDMRLMIPAPYSGI